MLGLRVFFRRLFRRSVPLLTIVSPGINADGRVQLEMEWNEAFVTHIRGEGFIGTNDEESVQMFLMSFTKQPEGGETDQPVNPTAHPFLNQETGRIVKR